MSGCRGKLEKRLISFGSHNKANLEEKCVIISVAKSTKSHTLNKSIKVKILCKNITLGY